MLAHGCAGARVLFRSLGLIPLGLIPLAPIRAAHSWLRWGRLSPETRSGLVATLRITPSCSKPHSNLQGKKKEQAVSLRQGTKGPRCLCSAHAEVFTRSENYRELNRAEMQADKSCDLYVVIAAVTGLHMAFCGRPLL
ncbi:MAG: hypothetical protein ACR2OJ_16550, partial [Hyphomicrobiales bacterium]